MSHPNFLAEINRMIRNDGIEQLALSYIRRVQSGREEVVNANAKYESLKSSLADVERSIKSKEHSLEIAQKMVSAEKGHTSKAAAERDDVKRQLERILNVLPEHVRSRVTEQLPSLPLSDAETSKSSNVVDITTDSVSSIAQFSRTTGSSAGSEDSDDWHLFPDLPRLRDREYKNKKPAHGRFFTRLSDGGKCEIGVEPLPSSEEDVMAVVAVKKAAATAERTSDNYWKLESSFRVSTRISFGTSSSGDSNISSAAFYTSIMENLRNREHRMIEKRMVMGERCVGCGMKTKCGKSALKCTECSAVAHEMCKYLVPKPCIPMKRIKPAERQLSIADYCPQFAPFVPGVVVRCVLEIEARGLQQPGLYKVPTFDREVHRLKEILRKNRGIPSLVDEKVNTLCEFLKDFFASLFPRLISKDVFEYLLKSAEKFTKEGGSSGGGGGGGGSAAAAPIGYEALFDGLRFLDPPAKDTLAFLILHLQNVERSKENKMSASQLSKVFTPILVDEYREESFKEEKRKLSLIKKFVKLPAQYWQCILVKNI